MTRNDQKQDLNAPSYSERSLDGRAHLVVPVVALVEGVHNALFYSAEEIAKYVETWNGVPVPVFHPEEYGQNATANSPEMIERQNIGRLFNVYFDPDGGKLKGEIWIDIAKADKIFPAVLSTIRSGRPMEVSTALWSDHDDVSGEWRGEAYNASVSNFRPDHLALLPGGEGACSWDDGCGIRLNVKILESKEVKMPKEVIDESTIDQSKRPVMAAVAALKQLCSAGLDLRFLEISHDDLRSKIQTAIDQLDNEQWLHFVVEVYDDNVIYQARGHDLASGASAMKTYQRGYVFNEEEDTVTLNDDVVEVREERRFVPVENQSAAGDSPQPEIDRKGAEIMSATKTALVQSLIDCDCTRFKADDQKWLLTLEETQLDKLRGIDPPPKVDPPETDPPPKVDVPETLEAFVESAPEAYRDKLVAALAREDTVKAELVKGLLANERNEFSEEELKAKTTTNLERLVTLGRVEVDFAAKPGAPASEDKNAVAPMPLVFEPATP